MDFVIKIVIAMLKQTEKKRTFNSDAVRSGDSDIRYGASSQAHRKSLLQPLTLSACQRICLGPGGGGGGHGAQMLLGAAR